MCISSIQFQRSLSPSWVEGLQHNFEAQLWTRAPAIHSPSTLWVELFAQLRFASTFTCGAGYVLLGRKLVDCLRGCNSSPGCCKLIFMRLRLRCWLPASVLEHYAFQNAQSVFIYLFFYVSLYETEYCYLCNETLNSKQRILQSCGQTNSPPSLTNIYTVRWEIYRSWTFPTALFQAMVEVAACSV